MARNHIKRKSTTIDMTAMCDVAFLLLSFFILATKFKPSEKVQVNVPNSVDHKIVTLDKDAMIVSFDKDGKTYVELSDKEMRGKVLDQLEREQGLKFSSNFKDEFGASGFVPSSIDALPNFLQLSKEEQQKASFPGVPLDSAGGELREWVSAAVNAYVYDIDDLKFYIKGDNLAKFLDFNNVLTAFKKNQVFKFKLITNPVDAPEGSVLSNMMKANGGKATGD